MIADQYMRRLPTGLLLNVGAGSTGLADSERCSVNVDIVTPTVWQSPFLLADAQRLPFMHSVFQGALLKDVIEHVTDPAATLREIYRVTDAASLLLISTPRALARAVWADYTHVRGFTRVALLTLLQDTGWAPVAAPRRMGPLPGAGRLGLNATQIEQLLRVPGVGHWFGTNWLVIANKDQRCVSL